MMVQISEQDMMSLIREKGWISNLRIFRHFGLAEKDYEDAQYVLRNLALAEKIYWNSQYNGWMVKY